jgi:hypothetical protein
MEEAKKAPETTCEKINRLIEQMDSDIANVKTIYDSMRNKQKILKKNMIKLESRVDLQSHLLLQKKCVNF